jgi:putative membrane protein
MLQSDSRFVEAVTSTVADIECDTAAEIVVVAAGRSAPYIGTAVLIGTATAWLAVALCMLAGVSPGVGWLLVELPLVGGLVSWWAHRSPFLMRALLSRARATEAVSQAASAAFTDEMVHGTRHRTGLLVYISGLERKVCPIADGGIEAVVPPGEWGALPWCRHSVESAPADLDAFLEELRNVGVCLARHLPADSGDNPDELSNAPRVRP